MSEMKQQAKTLRRDALHLLDVCAGWNSRRAARLIGQYLDRELSACGMTVAQLSLMAQIAAASDDRLGRLAETTGLDPSTLSRNLRALERRGLVEIATVETDLRRRAVWLTERGARQVETALPVWRRAHARLGRRLPTELVKELADQAARLVRPEGDRQR
jgi:DNA-binding MarR family transcriptional regulator